MKKLINAGRGDWLLNKIHMEHPTGVSLTVPDESLSVHEILRRFSTGMPTGNSHEPVFYDTDDFDSDDIEKLNHEDLFDREQTTERYRSENKNKQAHIDEQIKKRNEALAKDAQDIAEIKTDYRNRKNKTKRTVDTQEKAGPGKEEASGA